MRGRAGGEGEVVGQRTNHVGVCILFSHSLAQQPETSCLNLSEPQSFEEKGSHLSTGGQSEDAMNSYW